MKLCIDSERFIETLNFLCSSEIPSSECSITTKIISQLDVRLDVQMVFTLLGLNTREEQKIILGTSIRFHFLFLHVTFVAVEYSDAKHSSILHITRYLH